MSDYRFQVPEGVEDVVVEECATRRRIEGRIREVFTGHGYHEVSTPTFEYLDVFNREVTALEQEQMYKFVDTQGRIVVLRPDVTVPIARMVVTKMKGAVRPLKLFHISDVFRIGNLQSASEREFTQAGIEVVGAPGIEADGEIIAVAVNALLSAGLDDFRIDIGQVEFFESIIDDIDIPDEDKKKIRHYIQHKNLVAVEEFLDSKGINGTFKDILLSIPILYGEVKDVLEKAYAFKLNQRAMKALKDIEEVYKMVTDYGYQEYVSVDLGMLNQFSYYTGIIFKGFTRDLGYIICSGGRYDNLYAQFEDDCPATGFAIDVNKVVQALKNQNRQENYREKYFLLTYDSKDRKKAIDTAQKLRDAGLYVELDITKKGLETLKKYAEQKGIKRVIAIGDGSKLEVFDVQRSISLTTSLPGIIARFWQDEGKSIIGWH